ncbi:glyoxylase-like metal-dependent hydrolase (beta-lactamase superfamily II) [Croceifilum oryzae]|uniref:Glyoxylase-like metal-dependent hydrolase (Beta-lactamase superfamily II) n=1 Tax=Croceifilum oryzae TaxID=1553429 RepID=A0AAJ1TE15_9BACL|nr:MBL fold metallo-hydrolase [Croceifilum oryzae]MDQ0417185.1 glyoxylase-like metal-dependent hydrolase (beta-lactamase superfamily II) [Croceifilum oryzae]
MADENTIERLKIFPSMIYQTNSTVLVGEHFILVVDPTWFPEEVQAIRDYVDQVKGDRTLYIFYTHADYDHIIAAGLFADAIQIGSVSMKMYPEKERELELERTRQFDRNHYVKREYPLIFPEIEVVITEDGQEIQLGETKATCYLTPGHTFDGAMLYLHTYGVWIMGDHFSDVELPLIDSVADYKQTVSKVIHWWEKIQGEINWMIPGHGLATSDRVEMKRRLQESHYYLDELEKVALDADEDRLNELRDRICIPPNDFIQKSHDENIAKMKEYLLAKTT